MNREEYMNTREKMGIGQVDGDVMRLFFEYWLVFRKDEYEDVDFEKFSDTFGVYLNQGFNFHNAYNRVTKYYDELHSVQTVISKKGEVLAIR